MDVAAMKLAFTYHMLEQVVAADADVDEVERAHLEGTFGADLLRTSGFRDAEGAWTQVYEDALGNAIVELPDRLTAAEKLEVLELLVDACAADALLQPSEVDVVSAAARMLEVRDADWLAYVERLVSSGRLSRAR